MNEKPEMMIWDEKGLRPLFPQISLRSYFAAAALQGIRAAKMKTGERTTEDLVLWSSESVAQLALADADALLKAMEQTK